MSIKSNPAKPATEHGGACPTCGHCKCCEKAATPAPAPIQIQPFCTRRHYPETWDWTYRPQQTITTGNGSGCGKFENAPTILAEAKQ